VLLVCTGNICRSALAERLGQAYLEEALGGDASRVRLHSAGVQAVVGSAMHPHSALVLRGLGGSPEPFEARQLVGDLITTSDLVVTMTKQHRRDVLRLAPRALARTFTLREVAGLTELAGGGEDRPGTFGAAARGFVARLASARSRRHDDLTDDIRDPIGHPLDVHQAVGEEIAAALIPLLDRLAALSPSSG
jgi:protein-tyrosine phosphatase